MHSFGRRSLYPFVNLFTNKQSKRLSAGLKRCPGTNTDVYNVPNVSLPNLLSVTPSKSLCIVNTYLLITFFFVNWSSASSTNQFVLSVVCAPMWSRDRPACLLHGSHVNRPNLIALLYCVNIFWIWECNENRQKMFTSQIHICRFHQAVFKTIHRSQRGCSSSKIQVHFLDCLLLS